MLKDRIAVVTGATRGIGKSIVEVFLKHGANVIGLARSEKAYHAENFRYYQLDVSNTSECEKIYNQIIGEYRHIDILVNCAGITQDAMTYKMSEEQFDDVLAVNLKGVWNVTRLIGPFMQENKSGSIINISSIVGICGNIGQANYAASKAGVIGMTRAWAKEFSLKGGNVRVNVIAPGYTMTDILKTVPEHLLEKFRGQTMLGRLAEPEDIANAALFLASDLSSYITGEVINVNGGMRL